jgi:hypothetical protein
MGPAKFGTRAYIAIAGGIDTVPWLGSRSTFHKAGVGGLAGSALKKGSQIPVAYAAGTPGRSVKPDCRPEFSSNKQWQIEVVPGPDDDWIDETGQARFLSSDWKLSAKSDRTGFRLDGPQWTFTAKAYDKLPENGSEPSNIIDHGYPLGAINLAGQTPIILVSDGPSMGGFINPYTVPSAAFWKLGQSRPGDVYRFKAVSVDEAQAAAQELSRALLRASAIWCAGCARTARPSMKGCGDLCRPSHVDRSSSTTSRPLPVHGRQLVRRSTDGQGLLAERNAGRTMSTGYNRDGGNQNARSLDACAAGCCQPFGLRQRRRSRSEEVAGQLGAGRHRR